MRFGTFVFPISGEPKDDQRVIEEALREAELAEEIGLDTVWLAEHHFDGAVAYADPLVFAAAVAEDPPNPHRLCGGGDGAAPPSAASGPDRATGQSEPRAPYRGNWTRVGIQ